jgi:hypothetical protein
VKRTDILLFLAIIFFVGTSSSQISFNKVVIWGHKMYSHTHSFIHYGFFKAFKSLGYEVYWLDKNDNISKIDFANSLFITEAQADQNIPLRNDCMYVLHNCNPDKYKAISQNQILKLQVYTNDCENRGCQKLAPYILYDINDRIIYMPWATDLLPNEIDQVKASLEIKRTGDAIFIGTVGGGKFGNQDKIKAFRSGCSQLGLSLKCQGGGHVDNDININLIKQSYLAPALQGQWQCDVGYIPCRIFKNISYGKLGATNNKTVYELFNQKIVYNPDCYQLCLDMHARMQAITLAELFEQMDIVRDNHTYLNRIENILTILNMIVANAEN